ncbi:2-dehydro-3-deoxygluconokinase [Amycolatopsis arida]|uniref:2-dehydro-3-deoxygluconokinase n=1 Tax=Amycolatopsis arida TaxID=587909 RepID=A0A1I6AH07_9PSEU|nr:sugar kinase [Amycolatopsis arida]TDX97731.1 2-dehydro-3-deoxygluconokinase [Amycolatopsis arida]SFQ67893.1 2-dehydro-3-deoxygluconokinase [Amycolatopsis arida]
MTEDSVGPEVLCVGESMALFVPAEPGPPHLVRSWHRTVGGAESNVACHMAALGLRSAWVSAVGPDPFGRALLDELAAAGVDVSAAYVDPQRPTGIYFKEAGVPGSPVRYYRTGSAASGMGPELLRRLHLRGVRLVHLSGITPALSVGCAELVRALLARPRGNHRVSFDVNWRPTLWEGRNPALLAELAAAADIVLVGDDEAEVVWGTGDPHLLRRLLPEPVALVVKHGERGATLLERDAAPVFAPALRVDVVEPVGAGDAFAAGFLAATLRGASPLARLRAGHVQAAATLRTAADVGPPLPPDVVAALVAADGPAWAAARLTDAGLVPAVVGDGSAPPAGAAAAPPPARYRTSPPAAVEDR